jgi:heat shock protein HslJ
MNKPNPSLLLFGVLNLALVVINPFRLPQEHKTMNKPNPSLLLLAVLSLALVVAAGCAPISRPAPAAAPPSGAAPSNAITNIVWQWTSVANRTTGQTTTVPNPQAYTIIFRDDGTVSGQADCNTFSGTYSQEGGFFITVTPDVMAACGGDSLDQQYLVLLEEIVAGGPDGAGGLALETAGGEQRMTFVNGGAAASTAPAPSNTITDIVWKWQTLEDVATGSSTRVPEPDKYTIVFYADGTTTGQADCNTFSGTYQQTAGFTISVTPDVMAACDQGSLDQQYLNLLDNVAAGGSDGAGGLMLQTAGGAQKLLFSNGGAAQ